MSNPPLTTRIILVDSQPAALANLRTALQLTPTLQLVGQAANSQEALQLCQLIAPEAVLVNLKSPDLDGPGVIRWIARQFPQITILALSDGEGEELLRAALDAGAAGYLPHDAAPEALASAIEHVIARRRKETNPPSPPPELDEATPWSEPNISTGLRDAELAEAARIQSSLLPGEPPLVPGWDLAVHLQPARETSGDFYDFIALEHGKIGIVIGDVSDKGLGAALFMAMTCTLFRTFAARQPSLPALTLSAVNERMLSDTGGSSFVTAFMGVLETSTGRMRYVNAGHVPPLLLSAQKSKRVDRLARTGMVLGVAIQANWQQKLVKFIPGDVLLLYTDGVLDAQDRHGEFYGEQRLVRAVRTASGATARQIVDAVQADMESFTNGNPVGDDVILMVLKRKSTSLR